MQIHEEKDTRLTEADIRTEQESPRLEAEDVLSLLSDRAFAELRRRLSDEEPADVAVLFDSLPREKFLTVYRLLPKGFAASVFVEMDFDTQHALIEGFSDEELKDTFDELFLDDTVDIIEEMPANVVKRILATANRRDRAQINALLQYPKNSAGSIMTTEFVGLKSDLTVAESFEVIRRTAPDKETIYTCYVIEKDRRLRGLVTVQTLLLADPDARLADIADSRVISVTTAAERTTVADTIRKYDLLALPVVDTEERLVGIVTVDDAMDVLQEEAEEDFAKMAAVTPSETPYLKTSAFRLWKTRIPWLLILMISTTFTGIILSTFEDKLAKCAALSIFIPMLMSTGGNSGSQTSVAVIRSLSSGELSLGDILRVLRKEAMVGLLSGAVLAFVAFGKILLIDRLMMNNPDVTVPVALAVCVTLLLTVLGAKLIGCSLPILARRIGLDPAVMASPFITTLVDTLSLLIYFRVAVIFIPTLI